MIPILYDKGETAFTSNGLGRLADCTSCTVTEERNGIYECEFTYPVTGEMYPQIQEGCILGVIHDDVHDIQPFDIYGRSAPINGLVTFYAHHISYRLSNIILKPMTAASCAAALSAIPSNTYTSCPFSFWTDKDVRANWTNDVPNPVRAILGGQAGSILDVYGKGEYEFDNWTVKLHTNRGVDNGVSIRYGVNLTDLVQNIDNSGNYTAVVPFWKSAENDTVVTLPEGYVRVNMPYLVNWTDDNDNQMTTNMGLDLTFNVEGSSSVIKTTVLDLSESFEEQPTEEQLRAEASRRLINSDAWLPDENIRVDFIDLSHTEEYKNVAALQRVQLCDRVSVYCGPLGVSAVSMQVIRVVFDVLTERYDEIELGKAKASFADTVMKGVADAVSNLPTTSQVKSMLEKAVDNATSKITGANGGHVRFVYDANGEPQEILIMDTDDIETAVKVWRWNAGGLGFSSHGYGGPYNTAMTADGQIVADMISTGTLDASLIKTGTLDGDLIRVKLLQIINENGDALASFRNIINIGKSGSIHLELTKGSFRLVFINDPVFIVGDMRDEDGTEKIIEYLYGDGSKVSFSLHWTHVSEIVEIRVDNTMQIEGTDYIYYYPNVIRFKNGAPADGAKIRIVYRITSMIYRVTFGTRDKDKLVGLYSSSFGLSNYASGSCSFVNGYKCGAIGKYSHAEGNRCIASGNYSHAEGGSDDTSYNIITEAIGDNSHAEGYSTKSIGFCSHAEGAFSVASGTYSHSEGIFTTASGECSHAEGGGPSNGDGSIASGAFSHAEGYRTVASGNISHASGISTIAAGKYQTVFGKYNVIDNSDTYVEIVGGGSDTGHTKNLRTLAWDGNEWIYGTLTQASDSRLKEEAGEVPDVSSIRARRFRWNDEKGDHDDKDHIGYYAQDVEEVAPYLVDVDAMGYKSLDYIGFLCAKVENLERRIAELEKGVK